MNRANAEEEFNRRLDGELKHLIRSFEDILEIARVGGKDKLNISQEQLQIHNLSTSILRSAHGLTSLTTQLKELLLLGDVSTLYRATELRRQWYDHTFHQTHQALKLMLKEVDDWIMKLDQSLIQDACPLEWITMQSHQYPSNTTTTTTTTHRVVQENDPSFYLLENKENKKREKKVKTKTKTKRKEENKEIEINP